MIPKFRVWVKEIGIMAEVLDVNFEECTVLLKDDGRNTWADFDQIDLMQSTGLLDKNGTEIFEGDIVKIVTSQYSNQKHGNIISIKMENGGFEMYSPKSESIIATVWENQLSVSKWEVIGNVYSNPELLEGDLNAKN